MISRVHRVSVAVLALLTAASACLAQDVPVTPLPAEVDTAAATPGAATPKARVQGIATMGGLVGFSAFIADADYSNERDPVAGWGNSDIRGRLSFAANFRYGVAPWLRWQLSPGYTWSGYKKESPLPFTDPNYPGDETKERVLTQVIPITAQLQVLAQRGAWQYHVGAGPGLYRVWIQNRRKVLKDPQTNRLHRGFYPGVSGEVGMARMLTGLPNTALEFALGGHWILAERDEQFPAGFNSFLAFLDLKAGLSYHFDPRARFRNEKPGGVVIPPR